MKVALTSTALTGVFIIDTPCFQDARGFFMETWSERDFAAAGLLVRFVQDSHSRSERGVLRGLHYQDTSAPLAKLVRCTVGQVFDVAVDLRVGSPTFGKWHGEELTAENKRQLYIPPGFGHGFQALSDVVEVQYKQTAFYTPASEGTVVWNDPSLGIKWPILDPIVSERDRHGVSLKEYQTRPAFTMDQVARL